MNQEGKPAVPIDCSRIAGLALLVLCLFAALPENFTNLQSAAAHPADELCSVDPVLCRELQALDRGDPLREPVRVERTLMDTSSHYLWLGITHIIPKGLDHILFVLALFLGVHHWRPLLVQVSAFTIAHTLTLALATTGVLNAPSSIVEPLIALSIAFVAIENIWLKQAARWRVLVVFGFGLLHGFGFAGVLSELGLERGQFLASLISFNIGVEIGQLGVIVLAFVALWYPRWLLKPPALYQRLIARPICLGISAIGLFWFVERIAGAWAA
jgi:hypothetical protein